MNYGQKNIYLGNTPFGQYCNIEIVSNDGIFNDIEKAIMYYHSIFGITTALESLEKVYFHNGMYEFLFSEDTIGVFQLVGFILVLDVEFTYSGSCTIQIGSDIFTCDPIGDFFKRGKPFEKLYNL